MNKLEEAMLAKNQDEIFKFYTDDCRILAAGAPMVVGKEGIPMFINFFVKDVISVLNSPEPSASNIDQNVIGVLCQFGCFVQMCSLADNE